jgi:hypothetical protein
MGESVPGGSTSRRRRPTAPGSAVLTPPTGLPALPDDDALVAIQRAPDDLRPAPLPPTVVEPCTCGHARASHDHYRRGHDCGVCGAAGCADFQAVGGPIRRAARRFGLSV